VLAVAALSVAVIGLSMWGLARLHAMAVERGHPSPQEAVAAYAMFVVLLAQMFCFVLAVGAAFLAAPSIAGDIESGVALVILPRPIRRAEVVLGKWLGLSALLTVYVFGAGGLELLGVRFVTGYAPPHPVVALAFIALQTIVLLTLALWLGVRLAGVTGGVIALVLYGVAWIAQVAGDVATIFRNEELVHACTVISLILPSGGLWRGAAFALEPALVAAASGTVSGATPFTVPAPPTEAFMIWSAAWLACVLTVAVLSFNTRDV
jgi:ABC-type transport system involved in multi-copper enzyme maturation permease subunit